MGRVLIMGSTVFWRKLFNPPQHAAAALVSIDLRTLDSRLDCDSADTRKKWALLVPTETLLQKSDV